MALTSLDKALLKQALEEGRLTQTHKQIIRDLERCLQVAGISVVDFTCSINEYLEPEDRDHLKQWAFNERAGTVFVRKSIEHGHTTLTRCRAIAGWFLRNKKNARVLTPEAVVLEREAEGEVEATVLIVPNVEDVRQMPDWRIALFKAEITERARERRYTILAIDDADACKAALKAPHLLGEYDRRDW